jgi:hypothetical protein
MVDRDAVGRTVIATAADLGLSQMTRVQPVTFE